VLKGEYNSNVEWPHRALVCLLVKKYTQEKRNIKMKIDKSLIVLALQTLAEQVVNAVDISKHDETLDHLIRIKEQIKLVKTLWNI